MYRVFCFITSTSPTAGAILSGQIGKSIGGYQSPKVIPILLCFQFCATVIGISIPLLNDFDHATLLLWMLLFFGGLMLPLQTGLMLSTVEPELRPKANALAYFCYNLLGFLPGPYIYGLVTDATGGKTSRWGLVATGAINVPLAFCLLMAWVYRPNFDQQLRQRKN